MAPRNHKPAPRAAPRPTSEQEAWWPALRTGVQVGHVTPRPDQQLGASHHSARRTGRACTAPAWVGLQAVWFWGGSSNTGQRPHPSPSLSGPREKYQGSGVISLRGEELSKQETWVSANLAWVLLQPLPTCRLIVLMALFASLRNGE